MSTHVPGYQSFLHHFVLAKLATSSIRVNISSKECPLKILIATKLLKIIKVTFKHNSAKFLEEELFVGF